MACDTVSLAWNQGSVDQSSKVTVGRDRRCFVVLAASAGCSSLLCGADSRRCTLLDDLDTTSLWELLFCIALVMNASK